jgi:hypothetical protein
LEFAVANQSYNRGAQGFYVERLGKERRKPSEPSAFTMFVGRQSRHQDCGSSVASRVLDRAKDSKEFVPVAARHAEVGDKDVRSHLPKERHSVLSRRRDGHQRPVTLQCIAQHVAGILLVVNEENVDTTEPLTAWFVTPRHLFLKATF